MVGMGAYMKYLPVAGGHKTADRPTAVVQVLQGMVRCNAYVRKKDHLFQRLKSSADQKKKTQVLNVDLGGPTEW